MPKVSPVVQDARHRAAAPVIGTGDVHMVMGLSLFLIGVICRCQNLFLSQNAGDLVRAFSSGTQLENALDDGSGVLVWDDLFAV